MGGPPKSPLTHLVSATLQAVTATNPKGVCARTGRDIPKRIIRRQTAAGGAWLAYASPLGSATFQFGNYVFKTNQKQQHEHCQIDGFQNGTICAQDKQIKISKWEFFSETGPLLQFSLPANAPTVNLYNQLSHGSFDYRYSGTAIPLQIHLSRGSGSVGPPPDRLPRIRFLVLPGGSGGTSAGGWHHSPCPAWRAPSS